MSTKQRTSLLEHIGSYGMVMDGKQYSGASSTYRVTLGQWVVSYNHPGYQFRAGLSDSGGPFRSERTFYRGNLSRRHRVGGNSLYYFVEGASAKTGTAGLNSVYFPAASDPSANYMVTMGTNAIARCQPAHPSANVVVALGELYRDGLPHILGQNAVEHRLREFRSYGDEYLNVEFGWKPFISDLKSLVRGMKSADEQLLHLQNMKTKLVRVGTRMDSDSWSKDYGLVSGYPDPTGSGTLYRTTPQIRRIETRTTETWFKGAYRFYLPDLESLLPGSDRSYYKRKLTELDKVLGLRPSPEAIWQLTPWTWMTSWFTNLGSVVKNVSEAGVDGSVLVYGYIMHHITHDNTYTSAVPFVDGNESLWQTFGRETKLRLPATPFGFGLATDDFTNRQWAILAALGMTSASTKIR